MDGIVAPLSVERHLDLSFQHAVDTTRAHRPPHSSVVHNSSLASLHLYIGFPFSGPSQPSTDRNTAVCFRLGIAHDTLCNIYLSKGSGIHVPIAPPRLIATEEVPDKNLPKANPLHMVWAHTSLSVLLGPTPTRQ